jgi:monothiol glutaredoxin
MQPELHARIADTVSRHRVVLFMKGSPAAPQCGFSAKVAGILDSMLGEYHSVDVLRDPELRDGIKEFSSWPTIPQLYVNGEFVGGSDIVANLYESGELQEKLGSMAAPPSPEVTLSDSASAEFLAALEDPKECVRLDVTAAFDHDLAVGIPDPRDLVIEVNGVRISMSPAAARRASGIHIDLVTTPDGPAFKINNPNEPPKVKRISATELAARMKQGESLLLIDVRTDQERKIASIQGARALDAELSRELESGPKDRMLVVQCHHGVRSQRAAEELVAAGFRDVYNLVGGIEAWSSEVDPQVPRY